MSARKLTALLVMAIVLAWGVPFAGVLAQSSGEPIVLTVLNYFDATNPNAQREIDEVWAEFERRNPDIRIVREDLYLEPFHQKTAAYVASGQLPDVVRMWPGGRSSALHEQRLVKDLLPFVEPIRDQFFESALQPQAGGFLAELPEGITATHVMYTNTKLLAELGLSVPQTYDELKAMVPKLRSAGLDVVLMGAQDDWVIQSTFFSMIVGRLAGDAFLDAILAGDAKFTDEPFLKSLRFYKSLFDDGILHPRIVQTAYGEVNGLFAQGRAPFMIDGDWKVGNFLTDPTTGVALLPPEEQEFVEMNVFPAIPGELVSNSTAAVASTGWGINANIPAGSAKEEAAWRLVQWLTSVEVQKLRQETGANCCSRVGVVSEGLEPLAMKRTQFLIGRPGTYVIDNVFVADVYGPLNVGLQEIALGLATPEQVAQRVQQAFDIWNSSQ